MRLQILWLILLLPFQSYSQWTQRQSFNDVVEVHEYGGGALCVCKHCAFVVEPDGEIQYLAKGSGLTSANISTACADISGKCFAVGYLDGSIDICSNGKLLNIQDLQSDNNLSSRKINSLACNKALIVAGCDFGVALIDADRREVGDVCSFKEPVIKVALVDGKIYARSGIHTYFIRVDDINVQAPERWSLADDFAWTNGAVNNTEKYKTLIKNTLPTDEFSDLESMDGKLVALSDNYSEIQRSQVVNIKNPDGKRFTCAFFNPYNSNHIFLGSDGGTLYEYLNHAVKATYSDATFIQRKVLDMECTPEGDLIVLSDGQISVFDHDGKWHVLASASSIKALSPKQIIKVSDYVFWFGCGVNGIAALDLNGTPLDFADDEVEVFYPRNSSGERVGDKLTTLCRDADGRVWVGSNKGVAYISSPDKVFSDGYFFVRPICTETSEHDGDYSQYLLSSKHITSIVCDAKSRKWISTLGSGVFVVNDLGDSEIARHNTRNSGLPGDTVFQSNFVGRTGEMYFSTNCGLASYLTDTQETECDLENVRIYPNPVRPDYDGEIFISGLEDDCDIRITDIAGNLVWKSRSEGGKVSWDGNNRNGNRCATGVYLVFIVNVNSKNTAVKKLLMVK